jgi:hypothetical protein
MVFYRSFYEALRDLDNDTKANVYDAIFDYGLNFELPELTGISKTVFTLIKPQLDANIRKFENGKQGGRPTSDEANDNLNETKEEPNQNQKQTKPKANVNANVNANGNEKVNENEQPAHSLITWIEKNAPTIQKLKEPLTSKQAESLTIDLNINTVGKKKRLCDMLLAMENYKPLLSKSKSANLTIRNWWKRELERMPIAPLTAIKMNDKPYTR